MAASLKIKVRRSMLSVVIAMLGCHVVLLPFVFAGSTTRNAQNAALHRKADAAVVAAAPKKVAGDEAQKTKNVDEDESGVNTENKTEAVDKEETMSEKLLNIASNGLVIVISTIFVFAATYYVFFTKQAEESYYYGAIKDRTQRFGGEEQGVDFREFSPDMTRQLQEKQAAEKAKEQQTAETTNVPKPLI
eukprot:CAMPEP_0172717060 /NCGR_PEP_ID=MMETSP1074-20121228/70206_1 /TAXON_ID=2916 /ORGANISM="Ceratium fusus, Strain PA161109" /LENGTH=189 /DNA_ID=CAMNT_0013541899 /DNA_START=57 /DNA_END=626 /DNA_ORIENTATION=+